MSETLTDNELASRVEIARMRGYAGQLRSAIRRAHRTLLEHEHRSPGPSYPIEALETLSAALRIPFPVEP